MKLSKRATAALIALSGCETSLTGNALAHEMTVNGRPTSVAAAHQAANNLVGYGLAIKGHIDGHAYIRYEITDRGREVAASARREAVR